MCINDFLLFLSLLPLQLGEKCGELKDIHLGQCYSITDDGMVALAKGCRKLQRLYLQENKLVSLKHVFSLFRIVSAVKAFFPLPTLRLCNKMIVCFGFDCVNDLNPQFWLAVTENVIKQWIQFCLKYLSLQDFAHQLWLQLVSVANYRHPVCVLYAPEDAWDDVLNDIPRKNPASVWACVPCAACEPYWPLDVTVTQFSLLVDTKRCTSGSTSSVSVEQ